MTIDEVKTLASSGDCETLEFKETTGTRRKAAMTVFAFLNQHGGQGEMVSIIDAIGRKIDLYPFKHAVLEDLFKVLLHKLMRGEVQVRELDLTAF